MDYNNDSHLEYLQKRKKCLYSLQFLIDQFSSGKEVYYYAALYMDLIIINNPNLSFDLIIVSSFMLACKISHNY